MEKKITRKKTRPRTTTRSKRAKKTTARRPAPTWLNFTRRIFLIFFAAVLCLVGIFFVYDYFDSARVIRSAKEARLEKKGQSPIPAAERESEDKSLSVPDQLEIPRLENGAKEQVIRHEGYTVSYNSDYRIANWVAYELTAAEATSQRAERSNKFVPDPAVKGATAYNEDYTRTGYDRGHLAPAGDMKWSMKAMRESFYLSNICPQKPGLNRGIWKDLEEQIRLWAKENDRVWIATGPIITSGMRRMGKDRIGVPDAFYKVVCMEVDGRMEGIGFLFENRDYANGQSPKTVALPIDKVEEAARVDFFPALPDKEEARMEADIRWSCWSFN